MIPFTLTPSSINLLIDGRMRTLAKDHINFEKVVSLVRDMQSRRLSTGADGWYGAQLSVLRELVDIKAFVARFSHGDIQIGDDKVLYKGMETHGVIVQRLIDMVKQGFDATPLCKFLENLHEHPIEATRKDIYQWLENGGLPITEDGCFVAFKKVRDDYRSYHDTDVSNRIGDVVEMPWDACDTNRNSTCSSGLHFCSYEYLPAYFGQEGRVVIVKIRPQDVAAIPYDYNLTKGRACKYEVIGEVPQEECKHVFSDTAVVSSFGTYGSSFADIDADVDEELADYDDYDIDYDEDYIDEDAHEAEPPVVTNQDELKVVLDKSWFETAIDNNQTVVAEPVFEHGKRTFSASNLATMVKEYGQRKVSQLIDVPRSTLQGWLKKI